MSWATLNWQAIQVPGVYRAGILTIACMCIQTGCLGTAVLVKGLLFRFHVGLGGCAVFPDPREDPKGSSPNIGSNPPMV